MSEELRDRAPGERAVAIDWNASTWNPYQVVLFTTQLCAVPAAQE